MKVKTMNNIPRSLVFFSLIVISTLLLISGCKQNKEPQKVVKEQPEKVEEPIDKIIAPILIEEGDFFSVYGWLDDHTIVYSTEAAQGSNVYKYDLIKGQSQRLFQSDHPIVTVKISPSKNWILIHSSPSTYLGVVTIIDQEGKIGLSREVESTELGIEWNSYDDNAILLSAFNEDWSYQTFLLHIAEKSMKQINIAEPFAYWVNEKELIYLAWNNDTPSLLAPLMKTNIENGEVSKLSPNVFQVHAFHKIYATITVDNDDKKYAIYSFYTNDNKNLKTIRIPQISRYSDWLVPYSDLIEKHRRFVTFQPVKSGDIDSYREGFQLVSYSLMDDNQELLIEDMQNEPLSCSPSGKFCLYGNYLEKLINLETKEVIQLVEGSF